MSFTKIKAQDISQNAIELIGSDWMLITAGTKDSHNCMTASWGGLGFLWNKPVAYIFVRPQRFTNEFIETHDYFTLSFFSKSYKDVLDFCGKTSGRNHNKAAECGLTIFETPNNAIGYEEASLLLECKKIYAQSLNEQSFIDKSHLHHYPNNDFHIFYIGEITNSFIK